jgi:hypothetical protein
VHVAESAAVSPDEDAGIDAASTGAGENDSGFGPSMDSSFVWDTSYGFDSSFGFDTSFSSNLPP